VMGAFRAEAQEHEIAMDDDVGHRIGEAS
jgi:hypothetical protein